MIIKTKLLNLKHNVKQTVSFMIIYNILILYNKIRSITNIRF